MLYHSEVATIEIRASRSPVSLVEHLTRCHLWRCYEDVDITTMSRRRHRHRCVDVITTSTTKHDSCQRQQRWHNNNVTLPLRHQQPSYAVVIVDSQRHYVVMTSMMTKRHQHCTQSSTLVERYSRSGGRGRNIFITFSAKFHSTVYQRCSGAGTQWSGMQNEVPANNLRLNGAPVNIVYHRRNADTAAFCQISSYS